jgi:ABC-2 type transport system permease protein
MLKLMKYEFRKQAVSKMVVVTLLVLLEIFFLIATFTEQEKLLSLSIVLLTLFIFGAILFLGYEAIITYSNDLKKKCSYMLFLTPVSTYSIVGAKVVSAAIQIIMAGLIFLGVAALNVAIIIGQFSEVAMFKEDLLNMVDMFLGVEINFSNIFSVIALNITSWISTITLAFFSITLSTTFLANRKFKGVVSFVIFVLLNILYSYVVNRLNRIMNIDTIELNNYLQSAVMFIFIIITYIGTAWMLDKKVSV